MTEQPGMSDRKLLEQVATLSERITDNRELTREVAMLLFQSGEKPSANRVLGLTRRGSMVTINDEMNKWWESLREKLNVRVVNPNVPAALLEKQGEVMGQIWDVAIAQAQAETEAYRSEAGQKAANADEARLIAEAFAEEQMKLAAIANERREKTEQALAAEQAARIAAQVDADRWRTQAEAAALELERARNEFTTELDRNRTAFDAERDAQRAALALAEQQFNDMRKQSLLEIDGLRTRNLEGRESLKKAEAGIARLQDAERALQASQHELHGQIAARDAAIARLTGETSTLAARLEAIVAERDNLAQARVEDRENHREAIAGRDASNRQLNETIASMTRTEALLREEIERLRAEKQRADQLRTDTPLEKQEDKK